VTEIRTDERGDVDEVAVYDAVSVHIERASESAFVVIVDRANGKRTAVAVVSRGKTFAAVQENDP
jgi:hypothetical protein